MAQVMQTQYQHRLISRFRAWPKTESMSHQGALVPPGLLCDAGFAVVLESLSSEFVLSQGNTAMGLPDSGSGTPRLVVVPAQYKGGPDPQLADLLRNLPHQRVFWLAEYPFWCDFRDSARNFRVSIDNRFFRYNDAELAALLEASGLGEDSSHKLTPHDLRAVSGAWPGITDAAVEEMSQRQPRPGDEAMEWPAVYSIARLDAVRSYFVRHWLPVLTWRYSWLQELCALPLVTLDLLAAVFHDAAARECLLMGWLDRCPGRVGEYRPEPLLDQLLRAVVRESVDVGRIEAAIGWYQRHGYPAEAIESAAFLGMPLEKLQQIIQHTALDQVSKRAPAWLPDPQHGSVTGAVAARAGAGVESAALAVKLSSSLIGTRRRPALEADSSPGMRTSDRRSADRLPSPAAGQGLAQLLQAIGLQQGYHWAEVSDAVTAAVATGFQRQQLNRLVDFVDTHLRPLLDEPTTPLSRTIRNFHHSAPAKATLGRAADRLNYRELQILRSICEGSSNQEISERLELKVSTVKWYGTRIYEKLGVRNRTQAALKARKLKLVD
jgi:DNA-binding CsgD family transcriptional regulator